MYCTLFLYFGHQIFAFLKRFFTGRGFKVLLYSIPEKYTILLGLDGLWFSELTPQWWHCLPEVMTRLLRKSKNLASNKNLHDCTCSSSSLDMSEPLMSSSGPHSPSPCSRLGNMRPGTHQIDSDRSSETGLLYSDANTVLIEVTTNMFLRVKPPEDPRPVP